MASKFYIPSYVHKMTHNKLYQLKCIGNLKAVEMLMMYVQRIFQSTHIFNSLYTLTSLSAKLSAVRSTSTRRSTFCTKQR